MRYQRVTRTYEQIYEDALALRQKLIDEGRDPKDGYFDCTKEEYLVIIDKPPFTRYELSSARRRLCGLLIIEDGHCVDCGAYVAEGAPHAWKCSARATDRVSHD